MLDSVVIFSLVIVGATCAMFGFMVYLILKKIKAAPNADDSSVDLEPFGFK